MALCAVVERGCALAGGRRWYRAAHLARLRVRREPIEVPALPPALEGFRIAQLSDLHAGPFLRAGDLAPAVERVNALEPDLVVLTGDLISRRWRDAAELVEDLARLRPRHGILAVFGNHDYHGRREDEIARLLAPAGVRFLRNASARLEHDGASLVVTGLEDLEEAKVVDVGAARADLVPGDLEVALCHHPAGLERLARPGCICVLSGHTHGPQIDLPGVRRLGPRHPGGRVRRGETVGITSGGLGCVVVPLRVRSPAEVVLVELVGATDAGGAREASRAG